MCGFSSVCVRGWVIVCGLLFVFGFRPEEDIINLLIKHTPDAQCVVVVADDVVNEYVDVRGCSAERTQIVRTQDAIHVLNFVSCDLDYMAACK